MITGVEKLSNYWVKREDKAGWISLDMPSGSKVRQYCQMAKPGVPMIVGCASNSAMQIYVAAAARQNQVQGIIYTAKCNARTDATRYAKEMGAELHEVTPGYMSVLRKRSRDHARTLGNCVKWDVRGAIEDAARQVANIPSDVARIVIPTGSGLTAVGVLVGLVRLDRHLPVSAIAVSNLANSDNIISLAKRQLGMIGRLNEPILPPFSLIKANGSYSKHLVRRLPDGTPLDPFYAAKAVDYLERGDLFWVPGLRPVRSMPLECRREFADWKGFI